MEWDSNPRYAQTYASFQDWCLRPLGHPSNNGETAVSRNAVLDVFPPLVDRTSAQDAGNQMNLFSDANLEQETATLSTRIEVAKQESSQNQPTDAVRPLSSFVHPRA